MRRRSRISASAPAGRASRNSGRVVATCTSETISGEGVSNVINQAAAESCIHVPMLETTSEIHSARNSGRRNGLHAEGAVILVNLPERADPSTLDAAVEHRLHVDDRRPVERLQVPYTHSRALNGEYPHGARPRDRRGEIRPNRSAPARSADRSTTPPCSVVTSWWVRFLNDMTERGT